jgi:hypothetical protein
MPRKSILKNIALTTFKTSPLPSQNENEREEEVFLLYTKGFENGPGINRGVEGEPSMIDPENGKIITHPIEQRRKSWLIDAVTAKDIEANLIKQDKILNQNQKDRLLKELDKTPNYVNEFNRCYGHKYEITGMQGVGNLTMNPWFVAYLKSRFTEANEKFLYLPEEDFTNRTYSCLVKYKSSQQLIIEDLKFVLNSKYIKRAKDNLPITDEIEFAVFGQRVVSSGKVVEFREIAEQFVDIRHLFKLPNLNPNFKFNPKKVKQFNRPRHLFGKDRNHDIWFGERQLLNQKEKLLNAFDAPILLDIDFDGMGAEWDLIEAAFQLNGYQRIPKDAYAPQKPGEWRKYNGQQVQIYLQRNVYPATMIGLNAEGDIVAGAVDGLAGRVGHTIEAMAQNMIGAGCQEVLLMDEGLDVFQWVDGKYTVLPGRGRIRAVLIFARKKR